MPMSTAQRVGKYRQELIAEGFTADEAFEMAREAARALVTGVTGEGLSVADGESA